MASLATASLASLRTRDRISVYWPAERQWFSGYVSAIDNTDRTQQVAYDDGDCKWHDLSRMTWCRQGKGESRGSDVQRTVKPKGCALPPPLPPRAQQGEQAGSKKRKRRRKERNKTEEDGGEGGKMSMRRRRQQRILPRRTFPSAASQSLVAMSGCTGRRRVRGIGVPWSVSITLTAPMR